MKLPTKYPVHAAELYAIWLATEEYMNNVNGRAVGTVNVVSDSRVALTLICERRGGLGQEINWRLGRIEEARRPVRLCWGDVSCDGLLRADRMAKAIRDEPGGHRGTGKNNEKDGGATSQHGVDGAVADIRSLFSGGD